MRSLCPQAPHLRVATQRMNWPSSQLNHFQRPSGASRFQATTFTSEFYDETSEKKQWAALQPMHASHMVKTELKAVIEPPEAFMVPVAAAALEGASFERQWSSCRTNNGFANRWAGNSRIGINWDRGCACGKDWKSRLTPRLLWV